MRTYIRGRRWRYWAGTLDDLFSPLQSVLDDLADHGDADGSFDGSVSLGDERIDADSLDELRESIRDIDIPRIRRMTVKIGKSADLRVDLDVSRSWSAVELDVRGTHERRVNGLFTTLTSELDRGRRISYELLLLVRAIAGLIVGVAIPFLVVSSGVIISTPSGEVVYDLLGPYEVTEYSGPPWAFLLAFGSPFVGIAIFLWGHTFAIKDLELLRPGETTRYRGVRGLVWAVLATLVIGPIAGIVWGLFF